MSKEKRKLTVKEQITGAICDIDYGKFREVLRLVRRGIIDTKSNLAIRALVRAAWEGRTPVVCELLVRGVDANAKDHNGHSALEMAIASRHRTTAKILIDWSSKTQEKTNE